MYQKNVLSIADVDAVLAAAMTQAAGQGWRVTVARAGVAALGKP